LAREGENDKPYVKGGKAPPYKDVFGFSAYDSQGIFWQTFFDLKTREVVRAFSGLMSEDHSPIQFEIEKWRARSFFNEREFIEPSCLLEGK